MYEISTEFKKARFIAEGAVTAALYTAATLMFAPISFGYTGIDIRLAEALTVLPVFTGAAVPGLFAGCILANILGGGVIWDIVFGSLATLIGAYGCRRLRKNRWVAPLPTVAANTVIIPLVLRYAAGLEIPLPLLFLTVGGGEFLSAWILGELLLTALLPMKKKFFG